MLTLPQVFAKTDKLRQENARFVRFLRSKKGHNSNGQGFIAVQSHSYKKVDAHGVIHDEPAANKYVTIITFLDNKLHCNLSCSCPDFMYRWEVALHNKKAADVEYSNGAAPNTTNPAQKPAMCKHLIAVYFKIQQHLVPK